MRALFIIFLCLAIFGTAGYYSYTLFIKPKQKIKQELAAPPTPVPPDPMLPGLAKAKALKKENQLIEARTLLRELLDRFPESAKLDEAKDLLGEINTDIFFSTFPAPEKTEYTVKKGDALVNIARRLKSTAELIMRANNLDDPTRLQIGQTLLVSEPDFSLTIDTANQRVILYNKGQFFRQFYPKSFGIPKGRSGTTSTQVKDKQAWKGGKQVPFGAKEYTGSAREILLGIAGFTLFAPGEDGTGGGKPGIELGREDMNDLFALVSRGVPVTITDEPK